MKKIIFIASATILCLAASAFLAWDSPSLWGKIIWYASFALAIVLIVVEAVDSYFSDRERVKLQEEQSNIKEYGKYALWNLQGSQSVSDDYCLPSELTEWTDGFVRQVDGKKQVRNDDEAIAHYKRMIEQHPRYPFPYYMLAEALHHRNDCEWRRYATDAVRIFEITTSLPVHSPDHREALTNLKNLLANKSATADCIHNELDSMLKVKRF